ncbi:MAG: transcription termination/antitermination protein NusG [Veillonellaceae bacterium]|nr:transcription termination/antitermination protein NusG [Veillonellaceae bacterium]MDD6923252.1 transcription termination/antitermination protein NusG [Veillonellaceae bacterium]
MENDGKTGERHWYVVHTYSGYENKVKMNLESRVHTMDMEQCIFNVIVPLEDEIEIKGGEKKVVKRKIFPGYVLVDMIVTDESWYVVRNTPGVTGFVGSGTNPTALTDDEVKHILRQTSGGTDEGISEEDEVKPRIVNIDVEAGDQVRITDGPFENFTGSVEAVDTEKAKLKILVDMPGREIPIELGFDQVEKIQ